MRSLRAQFRSGGTLNLNYWGFSMREQFHLRLTHKIMAIGIVGLVGLLAFGAIYQIGSWSQDASRAIAGNARTISDLSKKLSMEMLEARRAEKDFQLRRDEAYSKSHAELSATIDREFQQIEPVIVKIQQSVERLYKEASSAEAATRGSVEMRMLIALGLAVVVVSGASLLIGRSISKALSAMVRAMTRLAGGDFTFAIPSLGRKDEVGEMAGAVEVF